MADRFPSLDEFDASAQLPASEGPIETSSEDFLAREKAALGDDADQFATENDDSAFADGNDLMSAGDSAQATFDAQFPDLQSPSAGTGGIPGQGISNPSITYSSGYQATAEEEEEPQVIKHWREERDSKIAKRQEQFSAQRAETVKEAQQNIDDFYENYNSKKDKGIAQTRKEAQEFLDSREDTVAGGTSWDRIAKLVDVSGKGSKGGASGSGKERFREVLTSLRKDEKAPGATSY